MVSVWLCLTSLAVEHAVVPTDVAWYLAPDPGAQTVQRVSSEKRATLSIRYSQVKVVAEHGEWIEVAPAPMLPCFLPAWSDQAPVQLRLFLRKEDRVPVVTSDVRVEVEGTRVHVRPGAVAQKLEGGLVRVEGGNGFAAVLAEDQVEVGLAFRPMGHFSGRSSHVAHGGRFGVEGLNGVVADGASALEADGSWTVFGGCLRVDGPLLEGPEPEPREAGTVEIGTRVWTEKDLPPGWTVAPSGPPPEAPTGWRVRSQSEVLTPEGEVVGHASSEIVLHPGDVEQPKGLRCGRYLGWTLCVRRNRAVRDWGD